jgi:hypothetical protein
MGAPQTAGAERFDRFGHSSRSSAKFPGELKGFISNCSAQIKATNAGRSKKRGLMPKWPNYGLSYCLLLSGSSFNWRARTHYAPFHDCEGPTLQNKLSVKNGGSACNTGLNNYEKYTCF